ncbi:MAG: hypothetical protein ACK528_01385 [Alphaproteobacteria bacterium]
MTGAFEPRPHLVGQGTLRIERPLCLVAFEQDVELPEQDARTILPPRIADKSRLQPFANSKGASSPRILQRVHAPLMSAIWCSVPSSAPLSRSHNASCANPITTHSRGPTQQTSISALPARVFTALGQSSCKARPRL